MLTKQERAWLKKRPNYITQTVSTYTLSYRMHAKTREWLFLLYESFDLLNEKQRMLDEAGAFESRVAKCLSERMHDAYKDGYDAGWSDHEDDCRWECFAPEPWDELKRARIKVEEEIGRAD